MTDDGYTSVPIEYVRGGYVASRDPFLATATELDLVRAELVTARTELEYLRAQLADAERRRQADAQLHRAERARSRALVDELRLTTHPSKGAPTA